LHPIAAAWAFDDANMQLMDLDAFWGGLFNFPACPASLPKVSYAQFPNLRKVLYDLAAQCR
jgi:hypothetical protein